MLDEGAELWWVGPLGWLTSRRKLRRYQGLKGRKIRFLGVVSDAALCRLYRRAGWSAYPSLYEGFGFPVLDALRHGTPVLSSYHSALCELDHPGVHFFDPYDRATLDHAFRSMRLAQVPLITAPALDSLYSWTEVARAILKPDGTVVKEFTPVVTGKVDASPSTFDFLHKALRAVATNGTAASVFAGFPIHVAGKTGTGQDLGRNANGSAKDDTSWFASFAPVEAPQYAVIMMVSQGGFGAAVSAVGVHDIYAALYGVTGSTVDPKKAIFPNGIPTSIPRIDAKSAKLVKP